TPLLVMILVLVYGEKENGAREYMSCENDMFFVNEKTYKQGNPLKNEAKENDKCFSYGAQ
ncbi:hypothetical protein, partial [Bacillus cereus]|uniref:hypothetical protein n=1 Tax=Bacillus cereus TaxID=1396 RepID=UPI003012A674